MAIINWPDVATGTVIAAASAIVTAVATAPWWLKLATPLTTICKTQLFRAKLEQDNAVRLDHVEAKVVINGEQSAIAIDQNKVIIELLEAAVVQCDAAGNVVWVSQRWTQFAGIQRDEALNNGWARAIHPDDLERVSEAWDEAVRLKRPLNLVFRFATGLRVQSKAVPIIYDGDVVGYRAQIEPVHSIAAKPVIPGINE